MLCSCCNTHIFKSKTRAGTFLTGSEHNDPFYLDENGRIRTVTNRSGGIQVVSSRSYEVIKI